MDKLVEIPEDIPKFHPVTAVWVLNATKREYVPWPTAQHQYINNIEGSLREFAVNRAIANGVSTVWAEFGVENGASANYWLERLPLDHQLLLFDSFEGLPERWNGLEVGSHKARVRPKWVDPRAKIIEGWFEDTLPIDEVLGFVHIDCDLYSSTKTVLERIKVVPGTVILFDELFGYEGYEEHELKALSEWDVPYKFIGKDTYSRAAIEIL